jgi:hypothetical protein
MILTLASIGIFQKNQQSRSLAQVKDIKYILQDLELESNKIETAVINNALTAAARIALPVYFDTLELEKSLKIRLIAHLNSTHFRSKIVPFLLHTKNLYYNKKEHVDQGFKYHILNHFDKGSYTPGMEHGLFSLKEIKPKKDEEKKDNNSMQGKMKIFVSEFLTMYDLIFLSNKSSTSQFTDADIARLKKSFEKILVHVEPMVEANQDAKETVATISKDETRKEIIALSVGQFLEQILSKHFQIFTERARREKAISAWLERKTNEFEEQKNSDIITFLQAYQNKKFAVHIIVDGLQGHLIQALTGNNDIFLKKILKEHELQKTYQPKNEKATVLAKQQITFLPHLVKNGPLNHGFYLPFFTELFKNHGNLWAIQGISTTPTISVRNLPMVMSGVDVVGQEGTGLPNFHYIDRQGSDQKIKQERAYYFFGNDALLLPTITENNGMQTMFTRLKKQGIQGIACHTNYDKDAIQTFDGLLNLGLGEKVRDFGEINCLAEISKRAQAENEIRSIATELTKQLNELKKDWGFKLFNKFTSWKNKNEIKTLTKRLSELEPKGLPSYIQIYNPWPDHFAHFYGPHSDAILSPTGEINRLDYWLFQLEGIFYQQKLYKNTLFGMAGDHGLSPIYYALNPELTVLHRFSEEKKIPLKIKKISSDEGEGPKLNHPIKPESMRGYDVVIASTAGGNYMMDFFINQTNRWAEQPLYEDLVNYQTLSGHTINVPEILMQYLPETLDYLVLRNKTSNRQQADISLMAMRGGRAFRERLVRIADRAFLQVSQADLLGLHRLTPYRKVEAIELKKHQELKDKCLTQANFEDSKTWCDQNQWRELFLSLERPDAVNQLGHLYDSDKAGTINLFPKFGIGYNTKVPGRHAGESFHEKDAMVAFWGGRANTYTEINSAVNGQVAPTLYEFLTGKKDKGFGFSVIEKVFNE